MLLHPAHKRLDLQRLRIHQRIFSVELAFLVANPKLNFLYSPLIQHLKQQTVFRDFPLPPRYSHTQCSLLLLFYSSSLHLNPSLPEKPLPDVRSLSLQTPSRERTKLSRFHICILFFFPCRFPFRFMRRFPSTHALPNLF